MQTPAILSPSGRRTCFHGAVDVSFGLIIDPVEAGLHRQPGQGAVFALVPVRGGDVHGPALVVQGLLEVVTILVPALCDPQLHPGPLIHHGDGQRVQLVFTSLCWGGRKVGALSDLVCLLAQKNVGKLAFSTETLEFCVYFSQHCLTA